MKISKILLETVLPITIGSILFTSYFFITERLSNAELESCERYELSNIVYLIFTLAIVLLASFYEIVIGNWILKKNKTNFVLNVFNRIGFATFFTGICVVINLFDNKTIEVEFYGVVFLGMFLFGLLILALIKLCQKIFKNKLAH